MTLAMDFQAKIQQEERVKRMKAVLSRKQNEKIDIECKDVHNFELVLTSMNADCKRVSDLPMGAQRVTLKKNELLPQYMPYVDAYLSKGEVYKNPLLVQVMVWCFDVKDIDTAIKLADICIEQKQPMPDRFSRATVEFVADEVRKWAEGTQNQKGAIEPYFSRVFAKINQWPIHDIVKVQYYKIAGREAELQGDNAKALELYKEAQKLDPIGSKVLSVIQKLEKKLRK